MWDPTPLGCRVNTTCSMLDRVRPGEGGVSTHPAVWGGFEDVEASFPPQNHPRGGGSLLAPASPREDQRGGLQCRRHSPPLNRPTTYAPHGGIDTFPSGRAALHARATAPAAAPHATGVDVGGGPKAKRVESGHPLSVGPADISTAGRHEVPLGRTLRCLDSGAHVTHIEV